MHQSILSYLRSPRRLSVLLLAGGLALGAAVVPAGLANAATLPSNCTASGTTVTCTFSAGSQGVFTVPAPVSSIHVVAVGAQGSTTLGGPGGPGAQVSADLSVTPGSTLFAEVGIGGGPGGADAASGGGESDLRSCSITDPTCPAVGTAQDPRLIVAGGGGGGGAAGGGGAGGGGGVGTNTCNDGGNGANGSAGTVGGGGSGGGCTSGGAGGFAGPGGVAGTDGTASSGGAGGTTFHGGGGGGAGFFGGGGGGSNGASNHGGAGNGGGGGGGSSFGPAGSVFATATTGPQVVISYTLTQTTTTLSSSSNPSVAGAPVTYTATVSPAPDSGTIAFSDDGSPIAGCSAVPVSGSTATCTTSFGTAGDYSIAAAYSGTSGYGASTYQYLTQQVVWPECCGGGFG